MPGAILVRICYTRPPQLKEGAKLEEQGWEHIAGPLAVPESFADGLPRILFDPAEIESAYDDWIGQAIKVCLDTGDPIASALRTLQFLEGTGIVTSGTPSGGKATFDIKSQSMLCSRRSTRTSRDSSAWASSTKPRRSA
jgi:hypothetical protein